MKIVKGRSGMKLSRHLWAAVIMFVVMILYRKLVLPHYPGLDTLTIKTVVAGIVGGTIWWIVSRGDSSR